MTPEQVEAHGKPVALLRPPTVRKLVALLRPLSVRERTTILAQAIHERAMTRAWADQVQFALAFRTIGRARKLPQQHFTGANFSPPG